MRRLLVLSMLLVGTAFAVGYGLSRGDRAGLPTAVPTVVDQVRAALAADYYRSVPPRVLRLRSVDAMLAALGDPYTRFLPRADYELLQRETAGSYSGIGVGVVPAREGLLVVAIRPGPARAAGIRVGDVIERIGSLGAAHLGAAEAVARIVGPTGTRVRLELVRDGRMRWLSVPRAVLRTRDVEGRLLDFAGRRWGELRIATFAAGTAAATRRELGRLERRGAAGFVLDLRDDPGGLLGEAVGVASLFLDRGVVVSLRGAHRPSRVYRAHPGLATHLPVVVLVDRATASSAEVVAAALRDHRRATIVGERTYGKAVVESVQPLEDGSALELTVARYYTANGADISGVGVSPDVPVVDRPQSATDEALVAALQTLARPTS